MKKNAMLKIAAILMVAVLLTTCAVSSTFAKYVSTGNTPTASANVAKWGVTISTTITDLFAEKYQNGAAAAAGKDVISSVTGTCVVAPGTGATGTMAASVTGTPEVAFKIATAATITLSNWEIIPAGESTAIFYCPLKVTVAGGTQLSGLDYTSATAFAGAIKEAIETAGTQEYAAGTVYASATNKANASIAWVWDFNESGNQTNANDTLLGNKAAEGTAPSISFSIVQTASQIQNYTAS